MNERIKELAKEAGFIDRGSNHTAYMNFDHEKFAELIVKECMACSTWVGRANTNTVEPTHTAHAINQRIKQQFGVEE